MTAETADFFSEIADDYDAFDPFSRRRAKDLLRLMLPRLPFYLDRRGPGLRKHIDRGLGHVLDLGCGTGAMAEALLAPGYDVEVMHLLDQSREMLNVAKENLYEEYLNRCIFFGMRGDMADFCGHKFEIIMASDVLTWVEDPQAFFNMARKMLDTHGMLVFSYEYRPYPARHGQFAPESMLATVEEQAGSYTATRYRHCDINVRVALEREGFFVLDHKARIYPHKPGGTLSSPDNTFTMLCTALAI